MNGNRLSNALLSALVAAGLGLAMMTPSGDALAAGAAKKPAPEVSNEAPTTTSPITLPFAGVAWGQSQRAVADAVDKILDEDYRPLYKKVQPGIKMKELDAQIAEDKSLFRRSRIDFGKIPTSLDSSPLRGEFTYNNRESLLTLSRGDKTTYFFFIQDKLWKVIDENKLGAASTLGKNWADAIAKLSTAYGAHGRTVQPDATHFAVEADWKDATNHLRAIQRSDAALALAYEESATVASLTSLRPNKLVVDDGIDPDVASILAGKGEQAPGPPPPPDNKKKNKR